MEVKKKKVPEFQQYSQHFQNLCGSGIQYIFRTDQKLNNNLNVDKRLDLRGGNQKIDYFFR